MEPEIITEKSQESLAIDEFLERFYEEGFYKVARYISRNGGTRDDAKDIFHDALVIYHQNARKGKEIDSELYYLFGVARNLWRASVRRTKFLSRLEETFTSEHVLEPTPDEAKLLALLKTKGKQCMDLLMSFYFERRDMKKIVLEFGFASEHSASVQKYKCLEKIREEIKSKSLRYEDFLE